MMDEKNNYSFNQKTPAFQVLVGVWNSEMFADLYKWIRKDNEMSCC